MHFGKKLFSTFFNKKIICQFDANKKSFKLHRTSLKKLFNTRTPISNNNSLKFPNTSIILKSAVFTVGVIKKLNLKENENFLNYQTSLQGLAIL